MFSLAKLKDGLLYLAFIICLFFGQRVLADNDMSCEEMEAEPVAWQMTEAIQQRFHSSFVKTENKRMSKRNGIRRIIKRIEANLGSRVHPMPLSTLELAKTIWWAAQCTQNDFQVITGMLEVESYICGDRTGPDGDSGCSMFTNDPIEVFKNQMKLPGLTDREAVPVAKASFEKLIRDCYKDYERLRIAKGQKGLADRFLKLFSGSKRSVKDTFIAGNHIHADILSGALYLKFKSAVAGGYWPNETKGVPNKYRRKGGVYMYNSSNRARAHANKVKNKATVVDFRCEEPDTHFRDDVKFVTCMMSDDPRSCVLELEEMANRKDEVLI